MAVLFKVPGFHCFTRVLQTNLLNTTIVIWTLIVSQIITVSIATPPPHLENVSLDQYPGCREYCDKHRAVGWMEKFQFNCDKLYDTQEHRKQCRDNCTLCPSSVCDSYKPNLFNCHAVNIPEECRRRCDLSRSKGSMDGYVLQCNNTYHTYWEVQDCKADCKNCPDWICNEKEDPNVFYCPIGVFDKNTNCKRDCEHHRRNRDGIKGIFSYKCTDFSSSDKDACRKACKKCPLMICNEHEDYDTYTCPSQDNPRAIPTVDKVVTVLKSELKYEGRCKDRCHKFRLGGNDGYWFHCEDLFKTEKEQELCKEDCAHCPLDICKPSKWGHKTRFNCPAAWYYKSEHNKDYKADNSPERLSSSSNSLLICGIFILILAITMAGVIGTYIYRQKQKLENAQQLLSQRCQCNQSNYAIPQPSTTSLPPPPPPPLYSTLTSNTVHNAHSGYKLTNNTAF